MAESLLLVMPPCNTGDIGPHIAISGYRAMAASFPVLLTLLIAALPSGWAWAKSSDAPSIEQFRRDYRAAYDRQVAATRTLKITFHRSTETLPMPGGPGADRPAASKTEEQIEKERERERRIASNNRLLRMDLTYYRSGDRERLDIRGKDLSDQEWGRSIVVAGEGGFAVGKKPGAREYHLEYLERGSGRAAVEIIQAHLYADAARQVAAHKAIDVLLGEEFGITGLRAEGAADGQTTDRLVAEVRRSKPPEGVGASRHVVRGTLTFEPAMDLRMTAFVLEMSDGFVVRGTVEYAESSGPRVSIPSASNQEISKQGDEHRSVQSYKTKDVSLEPLPDELFTLQSFGINATRPAGASLSPLVPGALGVALIGVGVVLYVRHSRSGSTDVADSG
jgi:hypothetical protein